MTLTELYKKVEDMWHSATVAERTGQVFLPSGNYLDDIEIDTDDFFGNGCSVYLMSEDADDY